MPASLALLFLALDGPPACAAGAAAANEKTVAVVAEDGLSVESEIRPLDPAPDLDSLLAESAERDRAWLYPLPDTLRPTALLGMSVLPRKGALSLRPELFRISRDPVVEMQLESRADIARWSVAVADPEGRTVRRYEGSGKPPARLTWDGRDQSGDPVSVGRAYSVHLIATDRAGNTATVAGDPAVLEGLFLVQKGRPRVDLPPKAVFEWGRTAPALTDRGKALLRETADILKSWPQDQLSVCVEGADLARAETEAITAAAFLADDLLRPRSEVSASSRPAAAGKPAALRIEAARELQRGHRGLGRVLPGTAELAPAGKGGASPQVVEIETHRVLDRARLTGVVDDAIAARKLKELSDLLQRLHLVSIEFWTHDARQSLAAMARGLDVRGT